MDRKQLVESFLGHLDVNIDCVIFFRIMMDFSESVRKAGGEFMLPVLDIFMVDPKKWGTPYVLKDKIDAIINRHGMAFCTSMEGAEQFFKDHPEYANLKNAEDSEKVEPDVSEAKENMTAWNQGEEVATLKEDEDAMVVKADSPASDSVIMVAKKAPAKRKSSRNTQKGVKKTRKSY